MMTDVELMQKYCFAPCFIVKRTTTKEEHEEYIPVEVQTGNERTIITFKNYFHDYAEFSLLSTEVYSLPELIDCFCKSLTAQSKLFSDYLITTYEYETSLAFSIYEPYALSCRYFMYKWIVEKGVDKMELTEIKISGKSVPLKKRILSGKKDIVSDYEYAIRCLRMNGIKIRERY